MPTYLWQASYNAEGAKGLVKDGGTTRRNMVKAMVEKAGGKLLAFYFAFGESDVYGIAEFPDNASAVATSLAVNASGAVSLKSTVLITPEEVDAAAKKSVGYRPPSA